MLIGKAGEIKAPHYGQGQITGKTVFIMRQLPLVRRREEECAVIITRFFLFFLCYGGHFIDQSESGIRCPLIKRYYFQQDAFNKRSSQWLY